MSRFSLLSLTLQNTTKPWFSFSASNTAIYFFIYPPFSNRLRRSNTGVEERLTRAASSLVVSRAFSIDLLFRSSFRSGNVRFRTCYFQLLGNDATVYVCYVVLFVGCNFDEWFVYSH